LAPPFLNKIKSLAPPQLFRKVDQNKIFGSTFLKGGKGGKN
jgi:hypothetical protein